MKRISSREHPSHGGFALIDLVVVVAGLAVLAGLLLPALAGAARGGQAAVCLNNLRLMVHACQRYTSDNQDRLPGALHGGEAMNPLRNNSAAPWTVGWLDWTTSTANTNTLFLTDPGYSSLALYLGRSPRPFKCPADRFISPPQNRRGWTARVRSLAGSILVGPGNAEMGPWDSTFKHVERTVDILVPTPAETWLYLEEHPDSINDPAFFPPNRTAWLDLPASYHNGACGLAFVDGRAEQHRWHGRTVWPVKMGPYNPPPAERQDTDWLRFRTPRVSGIY